MTTAWPPAGSPGSAVVALADGLRRGSAHLALEARQDFLAALGVVEEGESQQADEAAGVGQGPLDRRVGLPAAEPSALSPGSWERAGSAPRRAAGGAGEGARGVSGARVPFSTATVLRAGGGTR